MNIEDHLEIGLTSNIKSARPNCRGLVDRGGVWQNLKINGMILETKKSLNDPNGTWNSIQAKAFRFENSSWHYMGKRNKWVEFRKNGRFLLNYRLHECLQREE